MERSTFCCPSASRGFRRRSEARSAVGNRRFACSLFTECHARDQSSLLSAFPVFGVHPAMFDLEAYFSRIAYVVTREPSLATLAAIHRHHVRAIPFENLDVLLGRGIRIDLVSIAQKLIQGSRGGYCFEQNGLLRAALTALGFAVNPLIARVRWQVPLETETAFTHMLLRVETEDGP